MNKMKKNLQSNILLLPALIAGFFCYLFPILIAFWKSLFLGTGTDFVGIQNYVDLFENEVFSRMKWLGCGFSVEENYCGRS